jgi:hypothetical protein
MNLRSLQDHLSSQWDWSFANPCFPRLGRIGDIDGFVELSGRFLFIETKRAGQDLPHGQDLAYRRLSRVPGCTVVVIWGDPGQPVECQVLGKSPKLAADLEGFKQLLEAWAKEEI